MTFTAAEKALTCLLSNADHMAFLHRNVPFSAIHTVLLFPVETTTHQFLGRVDKSRVFSFVCCALGSLLRLRCSYLYLSGIDDLAYRLVIVLFAFYRLIKPSGLSWKCHL